MIIWTNIRNPFLLGVEFLYIGTDIPSECDKILLSKGYYGIIVKNPIRRCYHIAESITGEIIGSAKTRKKVIDRVLLGVEISDSWIMMIMKQQVEWVKNQLKNVEIMESNAFFYKFRKFKLRKRPRRVLNARSIPE